MPCKRCGSHAINHNAHGRDGSDPDLCDVCYWRKRAEEENAACIEDVRTVGGKFAVECEALIRARRK